MRALSALLATIALAIACPAAWSGAPVRVATNPDSIGGAVLGDVILYPGESLANGFELWRSNGTEAGTALVKDIYPGSASSYPTNFAVAGGVVYFTANVSDTVHALWKSDGTPAGTTKVADLPGTPAGLHAAGSSVYFHVLAGDISLWRSDGTPGGTLLLKGNLSLLALEFTVAAGKVFFSMDDGVRGEELWMTDGTPQGTVLVKDINPDGDALALGLRSANGLLLFEAFSVPDGLRMWRSDGTPAGTQSVGGPVVTGVVGPVLGNAVLMAGGDGGDTELWRTDGTANGTTQVRDIVPAAGSFPTDFIEHRGTAYFTALLNGLRRRFRRAATAGGTVQMSAPQPPVGSLARALGGAAEDIFFLASDGSIWGADRNLRISRQRFQRAPTDVYAWFRLAPGGLYFALYRSSPGGDSTELWFLPVEDPAGDQDFDGVPNGIEPGEGLNPQLKDNDIFALPRLFAMQQYRDFLGREGDAAGIQFYVNLINNAQATRDQIIESFIASPEFATGLPSVIRLYFSFFNRIPDYGGLIFQVTALRQGVPLEAIAQNFYNSPEFTNTYGALTNDQYINLVYQNVLGRSPDPAGFAFYKNLLDNGTITRGQMMIGFSESPEFQQLTDNESFVVSVYVGLLRRTPEQAGLAFYVNLLDGGLPRANMIPGFSNSPEYRGRFLPP